LQPDAWNHPQNLKFALLFIPDGPVRNPKFIANDDKTISASRQGRDILLADRNDNPGLKKEYLTPKGVNKMTGPGWL
jgi:hypothetical protein